MAIVLTGVGPGVSVQRFTTIDYAGRPCLFLDRDGVLVEEVNYLHNIADVAIIPGVPQAIASANALGIPIVMVTNQAGIGRGYFNWDQFHAVQEYIFRQCTQHGAQFDMALACAYHADGLAPYDEANHPWRKPAPGMLLCGGEVLNIDLTQSHIVGDTLNDLWAGFNAGLPGGTLVQTGHGLQEWRDGGESSFTRMMETESFLPKRAENAAQAIHNWLERLKPPLDVA
jgi:D-glycero-D-manno-heptose 1,7-bisphosphate phosphatase